MNYPRLVIAATGSGSGKTTITCGILGALLELGLNPCSFKAGPDYIDPMFHRNVLNVPSGNLDTFFTGEESTCQLFTSEYHGDIAIIEGVMVPFLTARIAASLIIFARSAPTAPTVARPISSRFTV